MAFFNLFKTIKQKFTSWREFGGYNARFYTFGNDIYKSEVIRSCIRPLAEFTSKADARSSDPTLERLLNNRPNMYMNGRDFLYKVRTMYELYNNVFIYISRDNKGAVTSLYPVPYSQIEALDYGGNLFIRFTFKNTAVQPIVLPWDDLAVLRKDYANSDIAGDDNRAILNTLELLNTMEQGMSNAIRSTANLRGILKNTKAMLSPTDVKAQKDRFVADYMNLENEGGVASLDATQEFTPISMSPKTADYDQLREIRENVYRYYGVNDDIVMGNMDSSKIEAFYELRVEPFLVLLSRALTAKIYTARELAFNNYVVYEANKLQFASLDKKISLFKEVVLYGGMTINEWRLGCNMAPLSGGDDAIMRLDAAKVDEPADDTTGDTEGNEDDSEN